MKASLFYDLQSNKRECGVYGQSIASPSYLRIADGMRVGTKVGENGTKVVHLMPLITKSKEKRTMMKYQATFTQRATSLRLLTET